MTEQTNGTESRVNTAALYLSASFFVVLGTINVVHNFIPLFRHAGGSWLPVVLGMIVFGLLPLGFGCWLVWRHDDRRVNGRA